MLGYEFPTTLFLLTTEKFYIVTTPKKGLYAHSRILINRFWELNANLVVAKHLEPLKGGKIPVEILVRGKDEAANSQIFKDLAEVIKKSGKKIGVIAKDSAQGPFVNDWKKVYPSEVEGVEEVDVAPVFSSFLAIKDDAELVRSQ